MSSDFRNWCSPIQDQAQCGSCTAFGTIGIWEAIIRIAENNVTDAIKLSERDLFFSSGGKCRYGNTMDATLNQTMVGVCTEDCCPYDGVSAGVDIPCPSDKCSNWWLSGKKCKSWNIITDVNKMKSLLPLVGTMTVHQSFLNYVSGVYHNLGDNDPVLGGHCVGIVGYDDSLGAWLLRNSWGSSGWGMQGYCWIKYGDSEIDVCMYEIIPDGEIPPPSPSPCPVGNGVAKFLSVISRILGRKGRFYYLNS